MTDTMPRILRQREVERITGLPRASLYDRIRAGDFPRQVRLSPRAVGWVEAEVAAWIAERIAASRSEVKPQHRANLRSVATAGGTR